MKRITLLLVLVVGVPLTGCKGFGLPKKMPWEKTSKPEDSDKKDSREQDRANEEDDADLSWSFGLPKEKKLDEPVKMFVTWTDSVYTQMGKPPTRGFAARIYFYNKNYEAIEVDGSLVVFGFDDTSSETATRKADKKFVFPPDHLASRFSHSQIGASYSVWVPWDEVGGPQKNISLLPVFRSEKGHFVRGEQVVNILRGKAEGPGQKGEAFARDKHANGEGVQQVAFNGPVNATAEGETKDAMKTTTINVSRSTMRHLKAPIAPTNQRIGLQQPQVETRSALGPSTRGQTGSHYIFDNQRAPIHPREFRRYPSDGAEPNYQSATASFPAATAPLQQQPIRSEPRTPQAPARPLGPPGPGPAQWQQYRGAQSSALPTIQQSYPQLPLGGYSSDARSAGY